MTRTNGFLCYAHRGGKSPSREYVGELQLHLNPLQPGHHHRAWSDQDIRDGADWPAEVRQALDSAAYAVLFVNIEFLNSEFVERVELPALLEAARRDGLLLLAVWVRPCRLPDWLARIQFSNPVETPLAALKPTTRDRVYMAIAERVAEHLNGSPGQSQAVRLMAETSPSSADKAASAIVGPDVDAVPSAPLDLAEPLSRLVAGELERIREQYRRGERADAIAGLDALLAADTWAALDPSLRGRMLRTAALYRLGAEDIAKARDLAKRADTEDPEGDGQVLAAHLALREDGATAALTLLHQPRSPEARHLKAAILVEAGDAEGALAAIGSGGRDAGTPSSTDTEPAPTPDSQSVPELDTLATANTTGETWRLRALALLALGRLTDAVEAIEQARSLAPDWLSVRSAAAVVDFWRACTPAALTLTERPLWPMPFARALVRADAEARTALAEAAQSFAAVASAVPEGSAEWGHWMTWRLIALLSAGSPRDEATTLANRLLSGDGPIHPWPLLWARFFELDLDRPLLKERLATVTQEDDNFAVLRGLLIELRLADGEIEAVLDDLATWDPILTAQGHRDIARQWRVFALTATGRFDEAVAVADSATDPRLCLRLKLHIARAQEQAAPGSHKAAAAALLDADPGPDTLSEACEAHALSRDWAFVAAHADALLEAIPTPASLRLLAVATWNQGEYQRCLSALDEHRHVYPDGRLPQDLALLRVRCQGMLGEVSQAAREARRLYEEHPSPEGLITLVNAQLQCADLEGMRQSLRRMLGLDGVPGDALMQAAGLAGLTGDRDLAVSLWRLASETGSATPTFAVQAAMTGSMLGLEDEAAPWFQRMAESTESGDSGVMRLHISEMPELLRAQREGSQRVESLYRAGEIPAHLLSEPGFPPLSVLFHRIPDSNRQNPDPLRQPPVLLRHGSRPMIGEEHGSGIKGRLILDITALLTAADLGLLDRIEARRQPSYLTPNWHPLLLEEIRRLRPVQPERVAANRRIAELVRASAIQLVDLAMLPDPPADLADLLGDHQARALFYAREIGGYLVDFLPLRRPDFSHWEPIELPPDWASYLTGPRPLLDLTLWEGRIDTAAHGRASLLFASEPTDSPHLENHPEVLLVSPGVLSLLAQADLLSVFCHRFRIAIPTDLWHQTEAELSQQEANERLIVWVQKLIERVSTRLGEGVCRVAPTQNPPAEQYSQPMNGLDDLLHFRGEPNDVIWIDDRLLSSFPSTETSRIVGIVEILELLRASGGITDTERFQWLAQLRAGNHRYIPLDDQEILYWVGQAHSDSGNLIVPPQLEVLARYWSACLSQSDGLQVKPTERHPHGELAFVASSRNAIDRALAAIWSDSRLGERRKRQRADWVLDRLYVGMDDIHHLISARDLNQDKNLPGTEIGMLVATAFTMMNGPQPRTETDKKPSERYLEWICERVIIPRLQADPEVIVPAAGTIGRSLLGLLRDDSEPTIAEVLGAWTLRFLRILPDALRRELHKDQALMQRLGLAQVTVAEIDGLSFAARDLWPALESALRGTVPILNDTDDQKPVTLRLVSPADAQQPVLELADAKGKPIGRHYFEHSEILYPSRDLRLQALQRHPHWWDGQPDGAEAVEQILAGIDPPERRIQELARLAAQSADGHYLALEAQWRRDRGVPIDRCFPPALESILTYVRCTENYGDGGRLADRCWDALGSSVPVERGLPERLRRITLLPCPLPDAVRSEISDLDAEQAQGLLKALSAALVDPVGRLHLLDLALTVSGTLPDALEIAQAQIDYLTTKEFDTELQLILRLIDIGYRAFEARKTADSLPQDRLLGAWIHAAQVLRILLSGGADLAALSERLDHWSPVPLQDLYAVLGQPFQDLAWPGNVRTSDVLFVGLGAILNRHQTPTVRLNLDRVRERMDLFLSWQPDPATDLHLLRDPYLLSDVLGCLWGGNRSQHLAGLTRLEAASRFSAAAFADQLDDLLTTLTEAPTRTDLWQLLQLRVGRGSLPSMLAERLDAIISGLDLNAIIHSDPEVIMPLMELAVRHASDRARIENCINQWSEGIDSGTSPTPGFAEQVGEGARDAFIDRLVNWMHGLAVRHPDHPDAEFARLLDGMILRSRAVAAYMRGPLTSIARQMPFARHRTLRRSLLCARSRPDPE